MENGVYINTNNGWVNANDNLNIRANISGADTINGTPTVSTVPKVFAFTINGWDQIYPAKEKTYGRYTINDTLDYYQWVPNLSQTKPMYGWKDKGRASQGYYGVDFVDDGVNDDMTDTQRRNIGWVGLGSSARASLPKANTVKQINYLKFDITRGEGSGHYREYCSLGIGLNEISDRVFNKNDINNPHLHNVGSPITLCRLNPCGNTTTSDTSVTIDLSSSSGKEIANMVMKWMRGESGANSIVTRNEEYTGIYYPGIGYWSDNYCSVVKFSMTIEYVAEA